MREHNKILFAPNLTWISICPKNSLRDLDDDFFYRKNEQWNNTKILWKMSSIGDSTILITIPPRINCHSILVVMGPKVNRWNKERKGCTNNFKNMLEAFVTMVLKNYLLEIAFPFHSSSFFFFFFFSFFPSLFSSSFFGVHWCATKRWEEWAKMTRCNVYS